MNGTKPNHYLGRYAGEQVRNYSLDSNEIILDNSNSIADFYRNERKLFLELLSEINVEYRLYIIYDEILKYSNILKKSSPEKFKMLKEDKLFNNMDNFHVQNDQDLLIASYLIFLKIVEDKYKRIELIKAVEIKWLSDYKRFIEFFQILNNANIVECDFLRFKQFFSLTNNLEFNSNLYETSAILYELVENQYISEFTLDSWIDNNKIIAKNGKRKGKIPLQKHNYIQNKSKYNDELSSNQIREDVYIALNKFGIILKPKN